MSNIFKGNTQHSNPPLAAVYSRYIINTSFLLRGLLGLPTIKAVKD